ncbi:predicted sugar phosphatase of the HAD superfamily [Corynebacterium jeikeium]|uniref:HAD-IIA family hydrolase n=1 Tax=Corynebacterium jeikeium TaxID=38289 RepID=UPI000E13273D|nr:HAD-IIA family hydrolase [Corynebacterium jeikeium]SUY85611.1 predicted sugar phosphatase of the HAD superfamily [Corynebacterium jeikeium]
MAHPLLDNYDALLADLDGTVFSGHTPIPGAAEGLVGRKVMYVTNNASRSPQQVAEHLNSMGFSAEADNVVTSAMAACDLGKRYISEAGIENPVAYVIGHDSFKQLVADAGFTVTETADDQPHIVFHGHSPDNNWARLSEGALAIRRGARYFASNLDTTLPSERGFLVGNGSMVAAVTSATGVTPESAGKPGPAMFEVAASRIGSTKPLAVGDRLDTDIAGGNAAGMDTLCTVTGVSTHTDIIDAPSSQRPTFIAGNLRDHLPGWSASVDEGTARIRVTAGELGDVEVMAAEALAVAAPLAWKLIDDPDLPQVARVENIDFVGADAQAVEALGGWK